MLTKHVQEAFARAVTSLEGIMKTGLARERSSQNEVVSRPSPMEFELAYQVRVAIDRIRFSIKATEQSAGQPDQLLQGNLLLLDALDRLQTAERSFQRRFRFRSRNGDLGTGHEGVNENGIRGAKS
jgi:hypothetical protein